MKTVLWVVAVGAAGIAVLDLATGSTSAPLLPASIGNNLTQTTDLFLLAGAGALWFFVLR